jgi:hypothetical protein
MLSSEEIGLWRMVAWYWRRETTKRQNQWHTGLQSYLETGWLTAAARLKRRHTPLNCVPFAIEEVGTYSTEATSSKAVTRSHRDRRD